MSEITKMLPVAECWPDLGAIRHRFEELERVATEAELLLKDIRAMRDDPELGYCPICGGDTCEPTCTVRTLNNALIAAGRGGVGT